jgi:hypothetical protein
MKGNEMSEDQTKLGEFSNNEFQGCPTLIAALRPGWGYYFN